MNNKKIEDKYLARSSEPERRAGYRETNYSQRESTRNRARKGCLVSIILLIVVMVGLYIIVFKSPLFSKDEIPAENETSSDASVEAESTPTPTPKPEATEVPTPTPEPVSSIGYISTQDADGKVRMREEPSTSSEIIGELHNREVLYILSKEGDYYCINYRGETAYVHKDYVVEHLPEDNMICDVVTFEIGYSKLVEVTSRVPELIVEMPYATESNHVNQQMYPFELVLLQESTAEKLKIAQELFLEDGYSLVIWDAYRPYSVTVQTFAIIGDPVLAADPETGSKHNRGAAIDVTLYDLVNEEYVDMPTEVREMDRDLAKRSSTSMTYEQRKNMEYMESILGQAGFSPYAGEWWHYNDMDTAEYPVLDIQFEAWEN